MGLEQCYRCLKDEIPKSEQGGSFQVLRYDVGTKWGQLVPVIMPFVGILCWDCALLVGQWLEMERDPPAARGEAALAAFEALQLEKIIPLLEALRGEDETLLQAVERIHRVARGGER